MRDKLSIPTFSLVSTGHLKCCLACRIPERSICGRWDVLQLNYFWDCRCFRAYRNLIKSAVLLKHVGMWLFVCNRVVHDDKNATKSYAIARQSRTEIFQPRLPGNPWPTWYVCFENRWWVLYGMTVRTWRATWWRIIGNRNGKESAKELLPTENGWRHCNKFPIQEHSIFWRCSERYGFLCINLPGYLLSICLLISTCCYGAFVIICATWKTYYHLFIFEYLLSQCNHYC